MDNAKLADEIELSVKDAEQYGFHNIVLKNADALKIIAALRRGPGLGQAQTRIAELEKLLREIAGSGIAEHWRKSIGRSIDSALKSRP